MRICIFLLTSLFTISCYTAKKTVNGKSEKEKHIDVPVFNRDSAYHYTASQVEFGPRVPNSASHKKCADYLSVKMQSFGLNVIVQDGQVEAFDNTILNFKNIIAQYKPELTNRILLCAHWDSRPFADNSKNPKEKNIPINGANDGASGVGVLMEIGRIIAKEDLPIGIDIIFFDAEDYGIPQHLDVTYKPDTWCLGSQYWGKNPHKKNYHAKFGILLDMVGAADATFYQEGYSVLTAKKYVKEIWKTASRNGFESYFIQEKSGTITDDHIYVNKLRNIPCVDIIHHDPTTPSGFGEYWHTHNDNMDTIDKNTLYVVGQTLLALLFYED